jgi:OOP family OmpA-OmpF porin
MATGTAAGEKANAAQSSADTARSTAETSLTRTGEVQKYAENLDNFQMASSKTVYFGFNKSGLTDDAIKDLDELAQSLSGNAAHYVIEVQGFTDPSGDKEYNYALSEKRANTVVRYLTEKGNIPVYRIHTIGLGKDAPATAATRREANKLSRRVEVKIYRSSADMPKSASSDTATPAVAQTTPASQ